MNKQKLCLLWNEDVNVKRIGYPYWCSGKGKIEKNKTKATYVETDSNPKPGLLLE